MVHGDRQVYCCPSASWRKGWSPQHVQGPRHHGVQRDVFTTFTKVVEDRFRDNQKNSLSVPIIPLAEVLAHPRWRGGSAGPGLPEPPIVLSNILNTGSTGAAKLGRPVTSRSASSPRSRVSREGRRHGRPGGRPLCLVRLAVRELPLEPPLHMLEEGRNVPAECDVFDTLCVTHAMHFVRRALLPRTHLRAARVVRGLLRTLPP
jgi:hypothetical protein